jgi:hypothetical protein
LSKKYFSDIPDNMSEKLLEVIFYAEASGFVLLPVSANVTIG